jgi:putative transposase
MTIFNELLDELLKGCARPEDQLGEAGLMKELKLRLMERMLGAELTAHLGYEAGAEPPVGQANRRNGGTTKRVMGQDGEFGYFRLWTRQARFVDRHGAPRPSTIFVQS